MIVGALVLTIIEPREAIQVQLTLKGRVLGMGEKPEGIENQSMRMELSCEINRVYMHD